MYEVKTFIYEVIICMDLTVFCLWVIFLDVFFTIHVLLILLLTHFIASIVDMIFCTTSTTNNLFDVVPLTNDCLLKALVHRIALAQSKIDTNRQQTCE